jgi:hypothetical protein
MMHAFVLFLTLCGPGPRPCEEGFMLAPSCAAAERAIRNAMRPGQRLFITGCEARGTVARLDEQ